MGTRSAARRRDSRNLSWRRAVHFGAVHFGAGRQGCPGPAPSSRATTACSFGVPGRRAARMVTAVTSGAAAEQSSEPGGPDEDVAALIPMLRRIVGARVGQHPAAEDLVQETLARVLAAKDRIEPGMIEPYAITTARNLVATMWRSDDREQRNRHRLHDPNEPHDIEESVVATEEQSAITEALGRLTEREREILLAHEVSGQDTRSLADEDGHHRGRGRRAAQPEPGPAPGRVPPGPGATSSPRPTAVDRSCSRCPAATGGGSGRWTRPGTSSSATSAPS